MKPTTTQQIIPESEIDRVHANANFGATPNREVVDQALLKTACGYTSGRTAMQILAEHGLVVSAKRRGITAITSRGRKYLYAAFGEGNY